MLATPAVQRGATQRRVPEVKVTVPVSGALPEVNCTVAEMVSAIPAMPGVGRGEQ